MKAQILLILVVLSIQSQAQPYVEGGNTRHRFAQLNMGMDLRLFPGKGTQSFTFNQLGQLQSTTLKDHAEARFIIGGTHFWGHADFYVAIPIYKIGKSDFSTGVETGAKYFPWRIEHRKVRPYVGVSLLRTQYKQGNGTELIRLKYPTMLGLTYNYKNHFIEVGTGYLANHSNNYYINTTTPVEVKKQAIWFSVGYKLMLETTVSAEQNWQNGRTKKLTDTLASLNKLNGFTLAAGISSTFFLKPSSHNKEVAPFIDNHKGALSPDLGIGYYFHKPDVQFNLSYRRMKSKIDAYDYEQVVLRNAFSLEAFKFLVDYHGFAAFVGVMGSYESLTVEEKDAQNISTSEKYNGVKPGVILGWDIRPNRLQSWYLRTNLRYFPNLNVEMPDKKKVSFDQLEFNFIQLVVFPGRIF